ncbi:hypothetical protein NMD65_08655 [Edwardsiella tarda]
MRIRDGAWFWPYGPQPLHGAINLTLEAWQRGWRHATLQARLNMLSQGEQGKANLVMQVGPGRLDLQPGAFPLRLDGRVNQQALSFAAALSAEVTGTPHDPTLRFLPGALLRFWGRTDAQTTIREARWPLAGFSSIVPGSVGVSRRFYASLTVTGGGTTAPRWPGRGLPPRQRQLALALLGQGAHAAATGTLGCQRSGRLAE